jgi:hypothetical protein
MSSACWISALVTLAGNIAASGATPGIWGAIPWLTGKVNNPTHKACFTTAKLLI